jgi:ribonuclease BN (tRNA processing enzyme)
MKIKVLGSYGSEGPGQRPSALLVDDRVLVDAGTVGGALTAAEQVDVEYALISHAHFDHIAGLCFLTDTLAMLAHVFNDLVWPNFANIPTPANPVLAYRPMAENGEARVGELWVTPIQVEHTIPTAGFIVHDGETGFVFSGDTGPTRKIWQAAKEMRGLKAVIIETSFPSRMDGLAKASGHLTPEMLKRELDKAPPDVPVWVYHVKPQLYQETAEELAKIDSTRIHILEQGKTYTL